MSTKGLVLVVVAMAALPACELFVSVPDYTVDPGLGLDSGIDPDAVDAPPAECEISSQCTAPEVCVMGDCRPCDDDAHCGDPKENVCLPDGACAALPRIAYASPTGSGATCSLAAPCSFDQAFAFAAGSTTVDIVKLAPGIYLRDTAFTLNGDTVILAGQGATLQANAVIQMLRVDSGNLTVVGAELVGQQQFNALCFSQGMPAAMTLYRVTSRGGAYGVGGFSCTLAINRSTVATNTNIGIYAQQGTARISNSVVTGNGGIANGSGGIAFVNCPDARVELSTITGNITGGVDLAAAMDCAGSTVNVTSSIVYGNSGPSLLDARCTVDYSIVEPTYAAGAHNLRVDPMFTAAGDFHIGAASPARGLADPALTSPAIDRDGQGRPQGPGAFDVGADEVP